MCDVFCFGVFFLMVVVVVFIGCGGGNVGVLDGFCVVVFGFDGMDYVFIQCMIDEGCMFNLKCFIDCGIEVFFEMLILLQSLVVWFNFIIGMDLGGYGIYDFFYCDLENYLLGVLSVEMIVLDCKLLLLGKCW